MPPIVGRDGMEASLMAKRHESGQTRTTIPSNLPGHSEEKCSSSRHADENVVIAAIIDAMIAGAANIRLF